MPHDKILIVNDISINDIWMEILIALTRNTAMADGETNAHKLMPLMIESIQIELYFMND